MIEISAFLVIRATLPTRRALEKCRPETRLQVRPRLRPAVHFFSQKNTPPTKYILCMPQAWLQRYNYKQPPISIFILNETKLKN